MQAQRLSPVMINPADMVTLRPMRGDVMTRMTMTYAGSSTTADIMVVTNMSPGNLSALFEIP